MCNNALSCTNNVHPCPKFGQRSTKIGMFTGEHWREYWVMSREGGWLWMLIMSVNAASILDYLFLYIIICKHTFHWLSACWIKDNRFISPSVRANSYQDQPWRSWKSEQYRSFDKKDVIKSFQCVRKTVQVFSCSDISRITSPKLTVTRNGARFGSRTW